MGVHLADLKVSYFSVPKCACTSLKAMFFEVENGFPFRAFHTNGKANFIHKFYPSLRFEEEQKLSAGGSTKLAVLRDPLARVVSCYRNRVAFRNDVAGKRMRDERVKAGLPEAPELNEFVADLDLYREKLGDVGHHSRPLSFFLGKDPSYFDGIFSLSQLDKFMAEVGQRVANPPALRRMQTAGAKVSVNDLDDTSVTQIKKKYAEDYDLFGSFFQAA